MVFNVTSLYIAQVKHKHGLAMRTNYNKPKSSNPKFLECSPEKESDIEAALGHFRMI